MSDRTRCLLDKVTARRILEGLLTLVEARESRSVRAADDDLWASHIAGIPGTLTCQAPEPWEA